jgi:DNA (cytosine-5)-methyltransferase 3A
MNILSLFDGISCGQVALERAGIPVDTYYASEIDKNAIQVAQNNYPNTIQLGDVRNINYKKYNGVYTLLGGSPCQDLSNYKYDRGEVKGLEGEKSSLFYYYVKALYDSQPKYFLLENVASMEQKWVDVISNELGVKPIMINSSLVCAAERKRLYWTNIPNIEQPKDKGIVLKDIILNADDVPDKYWYSREFTYNGDNEKVQCTILGSGLMRNMREVYNINGKCNTLLADGSGGNRQKKIYQDGRCRKLMPIEYERLQTLPDNYTSCVADCHRYNSVGNGWTVDVIAHILSHI